VFTTVFTQMQNERAIAAIFGLEGVSGSSAHIGPAIGPEVALSAKGRHSRVRITRHLAAVHGTRYTESTRGWRTKEF
jgi:hypothetical protein